MFTNLLNFIDTILSSDYLLFGSELLSLGLKLILLGALIARGLRNTSTKTPWILFVCVLLFSSSTNIGWLAYLLFFKLFPIAAEYKHFVVGVIRISWGLVIAQYLSLGLLLDSLAHKHIKLSSFKKFILIISIFIAATFVCNGLLVLFSHYQAACQALEWLGQFGSIETVEQLSAVYATCIIMGPYIIESLKTARSHTIPRILQKQLKVFIGYLVFPYVVVDILTAFLNNHTFVSISTGLLTYALYFSTSRVIQLRFLNHKNHVQSKDKFNFLDFFEDVLEKFSQVTSTQELTHITRQFFKDAFHIPTGRVHLYVRNFDHLNAPAGKQELNYTQETVENLISSHDTAPDVISHMQHLKILIHDELAFTNFYKNEQHTSYLLKFLDAIDTDIFIPIYEKESMAAYIIVERNARPNEFYSKVERDEIILFASYLGNIINLLQNRNLTSLIEKEKQLNEELYSKHQEINQYKESIRSFLRSSKSRAIGIIFYKNRSFIFANQAAQELVTINLNTQAGHPLTKTCKEIARRVEKYKSPQTLFSTNAQGERIIIFGIPNLESNNIILIVSYPEVSDIIKKQVDLLKNPSNWDYLLYLETTQSGKLINQLIPGNGETLLNYKIDLLKIALTPKAVVLDIPEEDIIPTVEIIHHISLRETLHVLNLQAPVTTNDIAIKLFGLNPTLNINTEPALMQTLNGNGTLFIKNVHFLDMYTQKNLAQLIRYGHYDIVKSDQQMSAHVRIVVSTNQDLKAMAQEKTFSPELYQELSKLRMPSLMLLSEQELSQLADEFAKQALNTQDFNNLLTLTERDKNKLINKQPISLQELKRSIQNLLIHKSKKSNIYQETQFNPAYNISDPDLAEAAKLGKHALREPKTMALLWKKFKNQNKIATFLGVNRSSVNRRCKQYNLFEQQ